MTTRRNSPSGLRWDEATGLMQRSRMADPTPRGALVPDTQHDCDQIAVVYDKGQTPPRITVSAVSGTVHTVFADGVAVAVVARATGPAPAAEDVLLVERSV